MKIHHQFILLGLFTILAVYADDTEIDEIPADHVLHPEQVKHLTFRPSKFQYFYVKKSELWPNACYEIIINHVGTVIQPS
jgi:hypothetical protein